MKSLDEQIDDIEKLDKLRQRARTLRKEAIETLTAGIYVPLPRSLFGLDETTAAFKEWKRNAARSGWELPGDDVEKAEVLQTLGVFTPKEEYKKNRQTSRDNILDDLSAISFEYLQQKVSDGVPIFRCATILRALAEIPSRAFSKPALFCLYRIVQELNEVAAPDWIVGAARADKESHATAFITGECAHALLALETALRQSAEAAELLGRIAARQALYPAKAFDVDPDEKIKEPWIKNDNAFHKYSLDVSLRALPYVLVPLSANKNAKDELETLIEELNTISASAILSETEPQPGVVLDHSVVAARNIADHTLARILAMLKVENASEEPEQRGKDVATQLRTAAQIIREAMRPMAKFAETVIDREIASSHCGDLVDGAELVFAARVFGLVCGWEMPKVRAAFEVLQPLLSTNGRLLSIRSFDVDSKGYRLNVATLDVTRCLADLLKNLDVEPELQFVTRLLLPFEDTRVAAAEKPESGWTTDPPPREPGSLWWLTAVAAGALDSMVQMLDATINRRVLRNFQVRQPASMDLKLDDLFYPDYGLATAHERESVAVTLQKLREHAGRGAPREKDALYSLILYGPPGTGKTTLVEAVAKTAGVPLVEITPSDILVGGAEGMERHARQVFQLLAKLTHVVILFDEFDSILFERSKGQQKTPTSVIEFLTPGMLPKLKALNNASKTGRMSYVLATNFLDRIDSAARRDGRFDARCGIYPPDATSRIGRLLDQSKRIISKDAVTRDKLKEGLSDVERAAIDEKIDATTVAPFLQLIQKRILEVAQKTRSGPMEKLGKTYSLPLEIAASKGKLFDYIFDYRGPEDRFVPVKAEADLREVRKKKSNEIKKNEYWEQWNDIDVWDKKIEKLSAGSQLSIVIKTLDQALEVSRKRIRKTKASS
jgi:adenylate kinase family enzyme